VGTYLQHTMCDQQNKPHRTPPEWPAQMKYVILALFMPLQMHSSLEKTAIYFFGCNDIFGCNPKI